MRARILTKRIELPNDPQLVAELSRLRTKYRAGSATVEIPRSGDSHCDLAVALMAAVAELDRHGVGANPAAAAFHWDAYPSGADVGYGTPGYGSVVAPQT